MASQFGLSECTPADVPGLVAVYLAAFKTDPLGQFTLPSTIPPSELNRWLTHRFTKIFSKREMRVFKITDTSTGTLCAFLRWGFPHVLTAEEEAQREEEDAFRRSEQAQGRDPAWPVGANLVLISKMFDEMGRRQEKVVDDAEWYVAHLLGTHPDYQRKGLATMLLKHVLDMADVEGRMAYIEATDAGHPVYLRLGFRDIDVVEVDVSAWGGVGMMRNVLMVRKPKKVD